MAFQGGRIMHRIPVFFFQADDGLQDLTVTGVQTCALPIFFMFLILPASAAISGSGMSMTMTATESRFSFLTLPLALYLLGYVVWLGDRVTLHAPALALATAPAGHGGGSGSPNPEPARPYLAPRCAAIDLKSTRLNSRHSQISYAVFCLQKKKHMRPH